MLAVSVLICSLLSWVASSNKITEQLLQGIPDTALFGIMLTGESMVDSAQPERVLHLLGLPASHVNPTGQVPLCCGRVQPDRFELQEQRHLRGRDGSSG